MKKLLSEKMINMYKVYVLKRRKRGSELIKGTKTDTPSPDAAKAAFIDLRQRAEFEGGNYILLMTKDSRQINAHRFDLNPGDNDYFDLTQHSVRV